MYMHPFENKLINIQIDSEIDRVFFFLRNISRVEFERNVAMKEIKI